jgi:hypothetical protein
LISREFLKIPVVNFGIVRIGTAIDSGGDAHQDFVHGNRPSAVTLIY